MASTKLNAEHSTALKVCSPTRPFHFHLDKPYLNVYGKLQNINLA